MAEEAETIEALQREAKAAVLRAIIQAAPAANSRGSEALESLARAFAATAGASPNRGEVKD